MAGKCVTFSTAFISKALHTISYIEINPQKLTSCYRPDQSGKVESSTPFLFQVTVGGGQYGNVKNIIAAETAHKSTQKAPGTVAQKPIAAVEKMGGMEEAGAAGEAAASTGPGTIASQSAEAGQKPMQAPTTQGEDAAKEKAEAVSKGPTATPTDSPRPQGPSVVPHPKKPGFFKRILGKLKGRK